MTTATPPASPQHQFPCVQCGANLQFAPGADSLECPYCGMEQAIPGMPEHISELDKLQPWDLPALLSYADEYLSGFVAESYQVALGEGFDVAKGLMQPAIHQTICRDIGGDHQRVSSTQTDYQNITFKHLLLPVWISAYQFQGKTFRFLVNARTGEVQGERPWSWVKIAVLVSAIVVIIVTIIAIANSR